MPTSHEIAETVMHEIMVDGVRQRYHVAGTGPVCLILSGGPGASWEYMRVPGLEAHVTAVYVEAVGSGASGILPNPRDYRIDTFARHLDAVADAVAGHEPVYLVGHSHGGFVAQHYTLLHPERVKGVVLYATAARVGEYLYARAFETLVERAGLSEQTVVTELPAAFSAMSSATSEEEYHRALPAALPAYIGDLDRNGDVVDRLVEVMHVSMEVARAHEISPFDVRGSLHRWDVPALVLVGERDFICGPFWGRELADLIGDCDYIEVPTSGHMIHLEEPDAFVDAVTGLIEIVEARGAGTGASR